MPRKTAAPAATVAPSRETTPEQDLELLFSVIAPNGCIGLRTWATRPGIYYVDGIADLALARQAGIPTSFRYRDYDKYLHKAAALDLGFCVTYYPNSDPGECDGE